ncbi:Sorting nexin-4 AltName: Full=Autophagy-related protein 24 [Serendipita indica DSM 11827]|uniref:Sorting nexin-4 n=1 Tax=Serendipita indica (strain DSM 11827) TaxID=1109443 RepID=G4TDR9_SERID|nr:Sorting nexin-4 AltName: Full=Autophagy-related protein 24 [Serendipita indica DSM 11827]CCA69458.1 related to SNX4-Sorting NeXin [Serendipita indica DSM 11827]
MEPDDVFDSVTWETPSASNGYTADYNNERDGIAGGPGGRPGFMTHTQDDGSAPHEPKWEGYLIATVKDPYKELDGTKDVYVSYLVAAKTNLPIFSSPEPSARRRFQDFVFLRENLAKDFPACVVPPLPDKHRLEYLTGDRFSPEFIERRRQDLSRFMQRVSNHPTLQRATLLRDFIESTEWNVKMHQHLAHPPGPEAAPSLLDNISDTIVNAFSRVRKPDSRFLEMRDAVDKFEESLTGIERTWSRARTRTSDLSSDYHDLAVSVQGLGFLESGITDPLNHFSSTLIEFSALLRQTVRPPSPATRAVRPSSLTFSSFLPSLLRKSSVSPTSKPYPQPNTNSQTQSSSEPFLAHVQSLIAYAQAQKAVLKLRDQKQLDFEELTNYLTGVTAERDRLSAIVQGHVSSSGFGLGAYLRDKVEALRGADDDRTRVEKMRKLDAHIKELQEAVSTAHETSDAFNDEVIKESVIFQYAKESEMRELLLALIEGQIEMYRQSAEEWDRIVPILQRIRVDV